jgi:anti-anti-sigma regulatory factor
VDSSSTKNNKKAVSRLGHDPLDFLDNDEFVEELTSPENNDMQSENEVNNEKTDVEHSIIADEPVAIEKTEPVDEQQASETVEEQNTSSAEEINAVKTDDITSLVLPSVCNISSVSEIHAQMKTFLYSNDDTINIQAGQVDSIDTAALQLLTSFDAMVKAQGKTILWQSSSDKFKEAASQLNFEF